MSKRTQRVPNEIREAHYRKQGGTELTGRQRRRLKHKKVHHELQGKQARLRKRLDSKLNNERRRIWGRRPK